MKIWILNHYAISPEFPGGTRHFDLAKELNKRGHEVTIFASSFHYSLMKETVRYPCFKYYKEEGVEGVKFVWIRTPPYKKSDWRRVWNMLTYFWRVCLVGSKKIAREIEGVDVVIGSSVHLFAVLSAYLLSRKANSKFIMEVRDLWPQTLIDMGVPRYHPFVILLGKLEKFLYIRADKIIVLLPGAKDYITKKKISSDKIYWIPNFVDIHRIKFTRRESSDEFVVTFMGSFAKTNNLDTLLDTAKLLKKQSKIIFKLFGDGPEMNRISQIIKKEKLENVKLYPPVPKTEISKVASETDAFIILLRNLPIYRYGISLNKMYDYMALGRPIIFAGKSLNNPIDEAKAGITVPPEDAKAIANAILTLKNTSYDERVKMGLNGRKYVLENNTVEVIADKFEKIILG